MTRRNVKYDAAAEGTENTNIVAKRGYTLVELIIVMVILSVLSGILIPSFMSMIRRAKERLYVAEAYEVRNALDRYLLDHYADISEDSDDLFLAFTIMEKEEIWDYMTVSRTEGARIVSVTLQKDSASVAELCYQVAGYRIEISDDGYTLTKISAYWEHGENKTFTCEFF